MQDVLAVGHTGGISTMLVPGAGEPNFDSYVADPFQGKRARQEQEVHQLLDKLKPEMIVLDPTTIGRVSCPAAAQHCTAATGCMALPERCAGVHWLLNSQASCGHAAA